jgi:hypothetical protein
MMDLFVQWLVAQVRAQLRNERGDVLVVLLLAFLVWLLVTGRKIVVQ